MNKILDIQKLNISVDNLLSQKKLISDISFNIKKSETSKRNLLKIFLLYIQKMKMN